MMPIKKLQDPQEIKALLKRFKLKSQISGYQIFDLECKLKHTDCYTIIRNNSDESMLIYKELRPSTAIIRSYTPESLSSFLEHLSKVLQDQFLLFVEGTNKKN